MFARGDLNIGTSLTYPTVMQMLMGFDPLIIWQARDTSPYFVVLLVRTDSSIRRVEDLKGKLLGAPRYQCPYFSALEVLRRHGLRLDGDSGKGGDVRYSNFATMEATNAALLAGRVDAVAELSTTAVVALRQGLIREIATSLPDGGYIHSDRKIFLADREWATANPDLVRAFIRSLNRARAWIAWHPEDAAAVAAPILRTPKEILRARLVDPGSNDFMTQETSYEGAVESLKSFRHWTMEYGDEILARDPLSDGRIEGLFDRKFFEGGAYYAGPPPALPPPPAAPFSPVASSPAATGGAGSRLAAVEGSSANPRP
jgi:ABC-type nitrate/sulfonate/bicarbonate transport system substrate-binding protein